MHTLVQGDLILMVVCLGKEQSGAPGSAGLLGEIPGSCRNRKPTVRLRPGRSQVGAISRHSRWQWGSRTGLGAKGEENQRGLETEQQRGEPGRYSSWKEGRTRGPICNRGHEYIDKELATAIGHGKGGRVSPGN